MKVEGEIYEINEHLFLVELKKDKVELNRPIQVGACILDISK